MATNRLDPTQTADTEKGAAEAAPAPVSPAAVPAKGGLMAWLPLTINVLLMPVLAYFMTTLVLIPKLSNARGASARAGSQTKSEAPSARSDTGAEIGKGRWSVPLGGKVLVNVAGTMGTRYVLANLTLVSTQANVRELAEKNDAELRDVAASVLSSKTIADLEKPGARNLIRAELISVFNNVLGDGTVTELYLTEFAIQ